MMKHGIPLLALAIACSCWPFGAAPAQVLQVGNQTVNQATLTLVPPEALPSFGSFYSLHRLGWPPLPAVPPAYAAAGLPVYWLGGHRYLIDDTRLDWDALRAQQQLAQAAAAMSAFGSQQLDSGGGLSLMVTLTATTTAPVVAGDSGSQTVWYQWRRDHTPLASKSGTATPSGSEWTATLTLTNVQCGDAGYCSVVFWNRYGEVASPRTVLSLGDGEWATITPEGPIAVQDSSQPIVLTANFCFAYSCVQWYHTPVGGTRPSSSAIFSHD